MKQLRTQKKWVEEYEQALSRWIEGFTIVALFGNSRTNVELFDDLFEERRIKIQQVLEYHISMIGMLLG